MLHSSHNLICVVAMFCLSADVSTFTQPHLCCCYVLSVSRPCNLHTASLVAMFCLSADIATLTQPHLCCCYVLSVSRPCNPHTASLVLLLCSLCQQTLQPSHSLTCVVAMFCLSADLATLTQPHLCCCYVLSVSRPCNPCRASLVLLLCSVCQQTLQPLHSLNLTQSHDCCCILSVFVKDPTTCQYYKMWC